MLSSSHISSSFFCFFKCGLIEIKSEIIIVFMSIPVHVSKPNNGPKQYCFTQLLWSIVNYTVQPLVYYVRELLSSTKKNNLYYCMLSRLSHCKPWFFLIIYQNVIIIGLVWGNIYNPPYSNLMVKNMVSCRFSHQSNNPHFL